MISLFIDTHFKDVVLALYKDEVFFSKKIISEPKEHSTVCIPALIDFLKENNIDLKQIYDIVVVNGPGSFTGVRIGVTIAKTLSYSLNIPIRTISSLEVFLPVDVQHSYVALSEKNGFFVGKLDSSSGQILEYSYLNKEEFEILNKNSSVLVDPEISFDSILLLAHKKLPMPCHAVNPFYVKKIEVEK